jgi:hypothetical protein
MEIPLRFARNSSANFSRDVVAAVVTTAAPMVPDRFELERRGALTVELAWR